MAACGCRRHRSEDVVPRLGRTAPWPATSPVSGSPCYSDRYRSGRSMALHHHQMVRVRLHVPGLADLPGTRQDLGGVWRGCAPRVLPRRTNTCRAVHLGVVVTHANRVVAGTWISPFRQPEALRIVAPRGEACGAGPCDGGGATWPRRRPAAYAGDPSPSGRYREDVTEGSEAGPSGSRTFVRPAREA